MKINYQTQVTVKASSLHESLVSFICLCPHLTVILWSCILSFRQLERRFF